MFIGQILYGYCGGYFDGYFGRDSYGDKRIEGFGVDWVVVREENGRPNLASFKNNTEMLVKIGLWSTPEGIE